MKETPAYGRLTALRVSVVPAISGPKFVSQYCTKGRCAPNSARKDLMAWRFSSDVTVPKDWRAKSGKMPHTLQKQDFMCARRSDGGLGDLMMNPWNEHTAVWWKPRQQGRQK